MTTDDKKEIVEIVDDLLEKKVLPRFDEQDKKMEALFAMSEKNTDRKIDALAIMLNGQFQKIDDRFEKIDGQFQKIDDRFEKIDGRFDKMDERFDKIENKMEQMSFDISHIKGKISDIEERLSKLEENYYADRDVLYEDIEKHRKAILKIEHRLKMIEARA